MDRLLTPEQAADALGVGRTTVFSMVSSGALVSIRVGRLRRIPASAVDRYIAGRLTELNADILPASSDVIGDGRVS